MIATGDAAPVAKFALVADGNRLIGHAAPTGGPRPCLLRLEADGDCLGLARATRHAPDAAARGLRLGWCGVVLPGFGQAAAIADQVEVRCGVSGRVLLVLPAPVADPPARAVPRTIEAMLAASRAADMCDAVDPILPFAAAAMRRGGLADLLDGAFRLLLGRPADAALVMAWHTTPPPDPMRDAFAMILASDEYRARPAMPFPGPFHPAFPFDLSPLDE